MSRRSSPPTSPWTATLHPAPGWVAIPATRRERQPLLPSRDPYLRAAKEVAAAGSISRDLVTRTQLYLANIIPAGKEGLAAAGRVRGSAVADAVLENCWVHAVMTAPWSSEHEMTDFVERTILTRPASGPPVVFGAALGRAVRFEQRADDPGGRLDGLVTAVVWLRERERAVVTIGGCDGPADTDWGQFVADLDAMVGTLELDGPTGGEAPR